VKPIYIFDLDGTLALIGHRRHLVEGPVKDWRAFFAACVDDQPNWPVIRVLQDLRSRGNEIWIWSGRSDEVREQTLDWLTRYKCLDGRVMRFLPGNPDRFRMRPAGDHCPDELLKGEWLSRVDPPERKRLMAVFEDRDRMVKMWRENGIACFQVAPGNF
jgi:hypothetical protein